MTTVLQVFGSVVAQSNTIDSVVVSVPVCDSPNGSSEGRLAVTFTVDGLPDRWISNSLSGISDNVYPTSGAGTSTKVYQYFAPPNTAAGSILTVTVRLGTLPEIADLDSETFSFNCSTGQRVSDPVAPFAAGDSAFTPYQTPVTVDVLLNDSDTDGNINPASVTAASNPSNGSLVNNNNGTFVYTPNNGFSGQDAFTYQVCDTTNLCSIGSVALTVGTPNRAPVANDDNGSTTSGVAVFIPVYTNDSDPDVTDFYTHRAEYSFSVISGPFNGTAGNTGIEYFTYTPNAGFSGTDNFVYQLCDNGNLCDTATVTIQVDRIIPPTPVNGPVALDDSARTEIGVGVSIFVLANDTYNDLELNLDSLRISVDPSNGTAYTQSPGFIGYRPNDGFEGFDEYTYEICYYNNQCDSAVVSIEVYRVYHPPVANDIRALADENGVDIGLIDSVSDVDGDLDLNTLAIITTPSLGTLTKMGDIYRYIPYPGYTGVEVLQYQICDLTSLCATATITIEVRGINVPPVANDDHDDTIPKFDIGIDVLGNDTDANGNLDLNSISIVTNAVYGTASKLNDFVLYVPDATYVGTDTFTYQVCDTGSLCDTATVTVEIKSPGTPPVANDDNATTPAGTSVVINVVSNDSDADGNLEVNTLSLLTNPANGNLFNNANGSFTYTPNSTFSGIDSFTYQICDSNKLCDTALVTIDVQAVAANFPPDCSGARPTIRYIWPPIGILFIPVQIRGVTDANHDPINITITGITQNESDRNLFRGDRSPDTLGVGSKTAWLRAERDPKGNGRIYTVAFRATDTKNGACTGTVTVFVPKR